MDAIFLILAFLDQDLSFSTGAFPTANTFDRNPHILGGLQDGFSCLDLFPSAGRHQDQGVLRRLKSHQAGSPRSLF